MKCRRVFTSLALITLLLTVQASTDARALYHQIVVPMPSPATMGLLQEIGVDLECGSKFINGEGLEVVVDETELALIRSQGIPYTLTQEDLGSYYEQVCLKNLENIPDLSALDHPVHMKYGTMGGFYNWEEIIADLDSMHLLYPDVCASKVIIGAGWDENPIYMVKISDNVEINEDEPEGIFDALHHAREPGGYTSMIYSMWQLLENYGTDPECTYLIDNRELYFVPVVNPDGFLYNQQNSPYGGGMWRKNRRNSGGGDWGVDLNRNYTYQWGYDNQGSSGNPGSSTYRGPSAGSEPETQTMMNFINDHEFTTGMTVHTASGKYLTAYGYDYVPPEHYDTHYDYMAYAASENGYSYGYCRSIMYASNGRTQDWQLHEKDIINVEPEVGFDGFWPPISMIFSEAEDQLNCYFNQFWCAGGQVVYSSMEVADGYLTPGESEELIVEIFNRGWGESEAVTYELTTTDPYVTLATAISSSGPLAQWSGANNAADPFIADISSSCPIGHEAEFTLTINQGTYVRTETFSLLVGTPVLFFSDNAESGTGNWTISSDWGLDDDNPHGGVYSFSDSPGRNYNDNENCTITLSQPLNLSDATMAWIAFWGRWDIEVNYDFCQLEVTTNGSSWTPVEGLYTQPGSGMGRQPNGQPGWEGTQATWTQEFIDLSSYAGQSFFKFRFEFKSDGGVDGDGFFFDDIQVLGFTEYGPPGDISVDLTYVSGSPVPASGGDVFFDVFVENYGTVAYDFDAWLDVEYEGGLPTTVVLRPFSNYLPGWSINRPDTFFPVPGTYAPGNYTMTGRVGEHPGNVWDESGFPFVKSGSYEGEFIPPRPEGVPDPFDNIDKGVMVPDDFAVQSTYPNPFNPATTISYALPEAGKIKLAVYDISGRQVATLADGWRNSGIHDAVFDASHLASGIYLVRLQTDRAEAISKIVLMK
jgi:hypothetical protein